MTTFFYEIFILSSLSICLVACNDQGRKTGGETSGTTSSICMKQVIVQDDSLGAVRNHACERVSLATTVRQYVEGLEGLDYSNCPEAFSTGFTRHRKAWSDMIPLLEQYPDMRGEMHDLFGQLKVSKDSIQFDSLLQHVWDTWGEIEAAMK